MEKLYPYQERVLAALLGKEQKNIILVVPTGGGKTLARPAAVVVISPQGVHVEPIVDVTKVAIAGITASGLMMATLLGMLNPRSIFKRLQGE